MDKYKTSELGKALKKVFHGEMSVDSAVLLAEKEIEDVFCSSVNDPSSDSFSGVYGDEAGVCPLCGKRVKKGRYSFICEGNKDGCETKIPLMLCSRPISLKEAKTLLSEGKTEKLSGFISKRGKSFDAVLALENGRVVFVFT